MTQKVDADDQLLGFFIEWILRFSKRFEKVLVICFETGRYTFPENVEVLNLGKNKGTSKFGQLLNFYKFIFSKRNEYDTVFVHMNPIWAVVGGLPWRLLNKKIHLWYTHKAVTLKLRLAEKFADTIFTASKESFRLPSSKVIVTGHGIDTELFKPNGNSKPFNEDLKILSVGRIASVKNYETLIDAARLLMDSGFNFVIDLAGEPTLKEDKIYLEKICEQIRSGGLTSKIRFLGRIDHDQLPNLYNHYDLFVHMSRTGSLDKAILEAMSCGLSAVSSNDASRAFLPAEYCFSDGDSSGLSEVIRYASHHPRDFRQYVIEHHNLERLINRLALIV
jgi:glycosyltransferase involved in cell wall biosynthesis